MKMPSQIAFDPRGAVAVVGDLAPAVTLRGFHAAAFRNKNAPSLMRRAFHASPGEVARALPLPGAPHYGTSATAVSLPASGRPSPFAAGMLLAWLLGAVWATPAMATDFVLGSIASTQCGLLLGGATTNATVGVLAIEQN